MLVFVSDCAKIVPFNWTYFSTPFHFHALLHVCLAVPGLQCCMQTSSSCSPRGYSLLWCGGFSSWWLFLGSGHTGVSSSGLWALERGLSSCGERVSLLRSLWNRPRPGIKPCPLHWQADSYSLGHQESPV